jgi:cytochrome c
MNPDHARIEEPTTLPSERFRRLLSIAAIAGLALCVSMNASASEDLARAKGCLACHSVPAKVVGPAYKDVASKYAGQADAEDELVQKVLQGGQGNWGFIPMPPNTTVSEEDARTLIKWILSIKS